MSFNNPEALVVVATEVVVVVRAVVVVVVTASLTAGWLAPFSLVIKFTRNLVYFLMSSWVYSSSISVGLAVTPATWVTSFTSLLTGDCCCWSNKFEKKADKSTFLLSVGITFF